MELWLQDTKEGIALKIHVNPRSSKDQVTGLHGDALNIKLKAPAVDGKANQALVKFLAGFLGVKKKDLEITSGEKSRTKTVTVKGLKTDKIMEILNQAY